MSSFVELDSFLVYGQKLTDYHLIIEIIKPETLNKKSAYFFIFLEINNPYPKQITKIQYYIEEFKNKYYFSNLQPKELFIQTIKNWNKNKADFLNYKKTDLKLSLGLINNKDIYISAHNNNLVYDLLPLKNSFQIKQIILNSNKNEQLELFSNLLNFQLTDNEQIIFLNQNFLNYFSLTKLKQLLLSRTIEETIDILERQINIQNPQKNCGALIINFLQYGQKHEFNPTTKGTEGALNNLNFNSQKILNNSLNLNIKHKKNQNPLFKKPTNNKNKANYQKYYQQISQFILILFKKTIILFLSLFLNLFHFIFHKHIRKTLIKNSKQLALNKKQQWQQTRPLLKFVIISTGLLIFLSSIFLINLHHKKQKQLAILKLNTEIQKIIDTKTKAEAKLIYNQRNQALELIQQAKKQLNSIKNNNQTKNNLIQIEQLDDDLNILLNKIKKNTLVKSKILINLNSTFPDNKIEKIIYANKKIFAFGEHDNKLYQINPITKNIEIYEHKTWPNLKLGVIPKEEDKIVFFTSSNKLVQFIFENHEFKEGKIKFPNSNVKIIDLGIFNRKLYCLDTYNQQIYKHEQIQIGYNKGSEWIKNKIKPIAKAVNLTIDGNIYILNNNGQILKFNRGQEELFVIKNLYPQLKKPTKIYTNSKYRNIYILEPFEKRLVILNKEGNFIRQLTDEQWQKPIDFIILEKQNLVYILDEIGLIYEFNLN